MAGEWRDKRGEKDRECDVKRDLKRVGGEWRTRVKDRRS